MLNKFKIQSTASEMISPLAGKHALKEMLEQKARLQKLSPYAAKALELADKAITAKLIADPGNGASIRGLKVVAGSGWFAARPLGKVEGAAQPGVK